MTSWPAPGRVPCVVAFCRRTRAGDPARFEFICGRHYRLVDRKLKLLRHRARRQRRWNLDRLLWQRMKRQARDRA